MFNMKIGKELFMFFKPVEPLFAGIFILISGLCCNLSHSNLKRGLKLLVVALFLSVVTYFLGKDVFISFGILHMLSLCMILCGLVYNLIKKINPFVGMLICAFFYVLTESVQFGIFGIRNIFKVYIPKGLYDIGIFFPFGIYNSSFYSADYFPMFPWMFVFFFGVFLGIGIFNNKYSLKEYSQYEILKKLVYKDYVPFLSFMGRNSLLIYIIHQPVIYIILYVVGLFIQ